MDRRALRATQIGGRRVGRTLWLTLLVLGSLSAAAAALSVTSGFGSHGIVKLGSRQVAALATQKDGTAVAGGYSGSNMLVVRISSKGKVGSGFRAGRGVANAVAVQSDGKIVVAGRSNSATSTASNGDFVVRRFNSSGSLDRRFGSGGTARIGGAVANAVAIGPKGTIIAAGYVNGSDGVPRVAVARFSSKGKPDRGFGKNGLATIDLGRFSEANGVAVQHDGKIVIAGDQRPDLRVTNALVARVSSHGALDHGFGQGGVYFYFHPQGGAASSFKAVGLDHAGRIVADGGDLENSGPHALFVRLGRSGRPDGGFGSHGVLTTVSAVNFNPGNIIGATGIVVSSSGGALGTGQYSDSGLGEIAVWSVSSSGRVSSLSKTTIPGTLGASPQAATSTSSRLYVGGNVVVFGNGHTGFVAQFRR